MLTMMSGLPGEVKMQQFDLDLKPRQGRLLPVRILHKVAFSSEGAPGPSRSVVINRAPGEIKGEDLRAAEVRFARIFNSTPVAIAAIDFGRRGAAPQRRLRAARASGRRRPARRRRRSRSTTSSPSATTSRSAPRSRRRRRARARSRRSTFRSRAPAPRARPGCSSRPPIRAATRARAPRSSPSTPPSSARFRKISRRARRCRRSASSPAASRTTSTTC